MSRSLVVSPLSIFMAGLGSETLKSDPVSVAGEAESFLYYEESCMPCPQRFSVDIDHGK